MRYKADPPVRVLGTLKPDPGLLVHVMQEQGELADFLTNAPLPSALRSFATKHGFAATEKNGMLFASTAGVGKHEDEAPALLWILCGTNRSTMHGRSHILLVGDEEIELEDGMVLWFDSTVRHGVIATNNMLWACYSIYCKEVK